MKSRQFFTYKFNSARLKEFNYNVELSFEEAQEYGEVIALFDNQLLRSIRDIHNRHMDYDLLEDLYNERDGLKRKEHSLENVEAIKNIQSQINEILFIPEYITINMDHNSHYAYMYKNSLILNGMTFVRFNSSASQARTSTVVFVEEQTAHKLEEIIDNGRNLDKEFVASKLNAYRGLAGSATSVVSTPRFCLVPDYSSDTNVNVNFVTETGLDDDDIIDIRDITETFNRFDGQGLISYEQASKWADELGLDYVPAQWCVRSSFLKGMLNTFPIHEFCEKINNGNSRVRTSYKDENGDTLIVDLKNFDVVISESQFKLWDSFPSIEVYQQNCEKNNLHWGVSLHSAKKDKDILKMNYQFLQTLQLNKNDTEAICEKFVEWISGVTSKNIHYAILFLMGTEISENKIANYLENGENHWIKSLIINPDLIHDKYIKKKIYDLIKRKIQKGCLGEILIDGNFQTIVSDPYAMMQHVCGLEVTGILKEKQYYSNYWNKKGVKVVDSMRAPLTYRSEHLLLNLQSNDELNYWYRYNYTGIIVNVHGHETMNWAGSDFDYDIIATTSDPTVIKGVYRDELPIYYEPPKSQKKKLTNDDLYNADLFAFGSQIGSITNKSTSAYALLPLLDANSDEYNVTLNRIKMSTKLQSAQIDKAKIGRKVKGIPSPWVNYQKPKEDDSIKVKEQKEFCNRILLDKHPYFFIYLYKGTKTKYKNYVKSYNITCLQKFGMELAELRVSKRKTKEQRGFLHLFEHYSPVIDSDCVMNNLCKYIESVDFGIRNIISTNENEEIYKSYINEDLKEFDYDKYTRVVDTYDKYKKSLNQLSSLNTKPTKNNFDDSTYNSVIGHQENFKLKMNEICSNEDELINYLIRLFYVDQPNSNKDILWSMYGSHLFDNVKRHVKSFLIPVKSPDGEITYLNDRYLLERMKL